MKPYAESKQTLPGWVWQYDGVVRPRPPTKTKNDGVRVNIAPLQRAGQLTANVLAGKDVEKAIADRAAWRDDERRWCREGKLPKPGWWE